MRCFEFQRVIAVGIFVALFSAMAAPQKVSHKSYTPNASDLTSAEALKVCDRFIEAARIAKQRADRCSLTAEMSMIHGKRRPLWRVRYGAGIQLKVDVETRQVVSFHDFAREEAQFKGTQPKHQPLIPTKQKAKQLVLDFARKLGIPESCSPDSFDYKRLPSDLRYSVGRAGMTFKNPAGDRVAGLSIDLLDGGVNGFWYAPWKVTLNVPTKRKGESTAAVSTA